jgi:hypothetical protein
MTEGLRQLTAEERARRDPRWVPPLVTWLASEDSQDVTARVFQVGNGIVSVLEGWRRGPTIEQVDDPLKLGPLVRQMIAGARKNAGMDGKELD